MSGQTNAWKLLCYPMVVMVSTLKSKAEEKSYTPVTHWGKTGWEEKK